MKKTTAIITSVRLLALSSISSSSVRPRSRLLLILYGVLASSEVCESVTSVSCFQSKTLSQIFGQPGLVWRVRAGSERSWATQLTQPAPNGPRTMNGDTSPGCCDQRIRVSSTKALGLGSARAILNGPLADAHVFLSCVSRSMVGLLAMASLTR